MPTQQKSPRIRISRKSLCFEWIFRISREIFQIFIFYTKILETNFFFTKFTHTFHFSSRIFWMDFFGRGKNHWKSRKFDFTSLPLNYGFSQINFRNFSLGFDLINPQKSRFSEQSEDERKKFTSHRNQSSHFFNIINRTLSFVLAGNISFSV